MDQQRFSVREIRLSEQKAVDNEPFPFVIGPETSNDIKNSSCSFNWVRDNLEYIHEKLLKHGAILFRDFGFETPEEFDSFAKCFNLEVFRFGGRAVRKCVTGNVYTANEAPPDKVITFHHEMAQLPKFPDYLFFYCDVAPPTGGQTPIVHSAMVYNQMVDRHPDFVNKLESEGIKYVLVMPKEDDPDSAVGRGWRSTFEADEKEEAEAKAVAQGWTVEWLPDDCMKTTSAILPGTRIDQRTGRKTWFNSITSVYYGWRDNRNDGIHSVVFGNGEAMCQTDMDSMQATLEELAVDFTWQKGDVIMIDNRQVLHGRRSFTPPRRILASLYQDKEV